MKVSEELPDGRSLEDVSQNLNEEVKEAEEGCAAIERLQPFIGVVDSGGRQLSGRTGLRFRELLMERKNVRP